MYSGASLMRPRLWAIAPQQHQPNGNVPGLAQSEDCLNLNVWTPGVSEKLKPVMVYIHGGGFVSGNGAECDGSRYAAEDGIVYVSINYRLGALGFLYLGDLLGKGYETSGNHGMLDIIAALRWVRLNIAAFGGDPSRVTVIGNSAGAKCTATLYVMEAAQGLFHRALSPLAAAGYPSRRSRYGTAKPPMSRLLGCLKSWGYRKHRRISCLNFLRRESSKRSRRSAPTPRAACICSARLPTAMSFRWIHWRV